MKSRRLIVAPQAQERDMISAKTGRLEAAAMSALGILGGLCNVRFTPKSGHWNSAVKCLLCANSGFMRRSNSSQSINSSASDRNDAGIVNPSDFAVFRLTTSSNLVDCSTGRSEGFAPLRIFAA
jgi:hypothetical protein